MSGQARRLEQSLFDHGLGRYPSMIETWREQRCLPEHPVPAQYINPDIVTNAF
jgi:hypothetical protein